VSNVENLPKLSRDEIRRRIRGESASAACSNATGDARISELAGLSKLAYARRRKEEAEKLGITVAALDHAVKDARTAATGEKLLYAHWNIEPCPEAVDTAVLLQSVHNRIKQHVIISDSGAIAVVLWTAMTWVHERSAVHSPLLMVTSAERDSGKSTLLGLLAFLVRRSLVSVGISAAALYRSIEKWQPAFVIDEADTIFRQNEDLREVVNSGWTRGQGVVRCEPETNEPQLFSTFCPKAIGLKGKKLPDTTLSRAIIVELKRKLPTETTKDFAHVDDDGLGLLRRKFARWAKDNANKMATAKPTMPEGFINRVAANWRLMLAIADLAGGAWPEDARKAATALSGPETSLGIKLLADVRDAFAARHTTELSTQRLVDYLTGLEDRDWAELNRGKPITKVWLSRLLGKFGLASDKIDDRDDGRVNGWRLSTFTDVFARYLSGTPPTNSDTRTNQHEMGTSCENELGRAENSVRVEKSQKPNNDGPLSECPSFNGGSPPGDDFPDLPDCLRRCSQCNAPADARGGLLPHGTNGQQFWLHAVCVRFWEARAGVDKSHSPQSLNGGAA
jgi:putative DNA primase/helicase